MSEEIEIAEDDGEFVGGGRPADVIDDVAFPTLTFELRGETLYTKTAWPPGADPETFAAFLIELQQGRLMNSIAGSARNYAEIVDDRGFSETFIGLVRGEMNRFLRKGPVEPVVRPRNAVPSLLRRGHHGD